MAGHASAVQPTLQLRMLRIRSIGEEFSITVTIPWFSFSEIRYKDGKKRQTLENIQEKKALSQASWCGLCLRPIELFRPVYTGLE